MRYRACPQGQPQLTDIHALTTRFGMEQKASLGRCGWIGILDVRWLYRSLAEASASLLGLKYHRRGARVHSRPPPSAA